MRAATDAVAPCLSHATRKEDLKCSHCRKGDPLAQTYELLQGAIDIHVHAGPHLTSSPRRVDPFEAAQEAKDAGMQAIVLLDVFEMTNGVSWLVNKIVPDFRTYGGLILNTVYGGMNPRAVKTALHYGDCAKYISFGAHSTYFQAAREGRYVDGKFQPPVGDLSQVQDGGAGSLHPHSG